eukprot:scaffold873_cov393-Prasinococcus_capsulatus_cf.AAC.16
MRCGISACGVRGWRRGRAARPRACVCIATQIRFDYGTEDTSRTGSHFPPSRLPLWEQPGLFA